MESTTLGQTGLKVSVAGMGSGGPSRLGRKKGVPIDHGIDLIHRAIDLGINFFDTAHNYGTEGVVGAAVKSVLRDSVVLSTKYHVEDVSADEIVEALDNALRTMGVDYLDIFHLHGVVPGEYDHARDVLVPALLRERERGKFRFLGITEGTASDLEHAMLTRALKDDVWDVIMVSFNMMHQGAMDHVLPEARKRGVGTLVMAPARCQVGTPDRLAQTLREMAAEGQLPAAVGETDDPLGFLLQEGGAENLLDAAYRFARHASGADVVLFGTGDPAHLEANVASLLAPPLSEAGFARLREQFGKLKGVGLRQIRRNERIPPTPVA
jgi:aryl-alcohol dehydrogenase-like predicted oxidoreductase